MDNVTMEEVTDNTDNQNENVGQCPLSLSVRNEFLNNRPTNTKKAYGGPVKEWSIWCDEMKFGDPIVTPSRVLEYMT